jgi:ferredoxin
MENAISYTNDKFIIDPKKCTDCGSCADICPAQAINKEE